MQLIDSQMNVLNDQIEDLTRSLFEEIESLVEDELILSLKKNLQRVQ